MKAALMCLHFLFCYYVDILYLTQAISWQAGCWEAKTNLLWDKVSPNPEFGVRTCIGTVSAHPAYNHLVFICVLIEVL